LGIHRSSLLQEEKIMPGVEGPSFFMHEKSHMTITRGQWKKKKLIMGLEGSSVRMTITQAFYKKFFFSNLEGLGFFLMDEKSRGPSPKLVARRKNKSWASKAKVFFSWMRKARQPSPKLSTSKLKSQTFKARVSFS
jgi:hypothetical protein